MQYPIVGGLNQCIQVAANTTYYFGYSYMQQIPNALICNLFFYAGTNCSGDWSSVTSLASTATTGTAWQSTSTSTTSPAGAGYAAVSCDVSTGTQAGWFDQIYLNATANQY